VLLLKRPIATLNLRTLPIVMRLNNRELHRLLSDRGISYLHHANTVATSLTYIEQGGLLSRGAVERRNLYQTSQYSDYKDKVHNIWDDVFLDTLDLHEHFNRQNHYGPVLFKVSIDFLLKTKSEVWVTKNNPVHWKKNIRNSEKYFRSVREMDRTWGEYKSEKRMITIRGVTRPFLFKYLHEIVLDDPELLIGDINLHNNALKVIRKAIRLNNLEVKIKTRHCRNCFCKDNYLDDLPIRTLRKLFNPPKS
jgi:hypothetical protein